MLFSQQNQFLRFVSFFLNHNKIRLLALMNEQVASYLIHISKIKYVFCHMFTKCSIQSFHLIYRKCALYWMKKKILIGWSKKKKQMWCIFDRNDSHYVKLKQLTKLTMIGSKYVVVILRFSNNSREKAQRFRDCCMFNQPTNQLTD